MKRGSVRADAVCIQQTILMKGVRTMNENDKQRRQLEPQIDSWNAELHKLESKAKKVILGRKSDYDIVMAALRQPRDRTKRRLK